MISIADIDDADLRQERNLSRARLILATASLAAIYVDPTEPMHYGAAAYPLLITYVLTSLGCMIWLARARMLPRWFAPTIHAFDVLSLAVLTAITGASSSPLFPFFTFIVLAAAFRWGYRETLFTTLVIIWVLLVEAFLLVAWRRAATASEFELSLFLVRVTYMAIAGILAAYLASHEKQLRLESGLVARILSRLRSETTLDSALETTSQELLRAFGAKSVAVAVREATSGQVVLWTMGRNDSEVERSVLSPAEADGYLAKAPAAAIMKRRRKRVTITATTRGSVGSMATTISPQQPFDLAMVVSAAYTDHWFGRVFLFEPRRRIATVAGLRLLSRVMEFTTPALHSIFLIRRLRSRSEASERARLARELHDTSVQSLIGLEMEVMALSRRTSDSTLRASIDAIHARLQYEIRSLRNLMAHLGRSSTTASSMTERLSEMLAGFQVETGIPSRLGQEVLRLVEAALSNVRRHSGATQVDVAIERDGDGWVVIIEDDGVGGREGGRQRAFAPWSMRERVTALGGQLVVEPRENAVGVRVEIRLPAFVLSA